jgi:hypothetical protein
MPEVSGHNATFGKKKYIQTINFSSIPSPSKNKHRKFYGLNLSVKSVNPKKNNQFGFICKICKIRRGLRDYCFSKPPGRPF